MNWVCLLATNIQRPSRCQVQLRRAAHFEGDAAAARETTKRAESARLDDRKHVDELKRQLFEARAETARMRTALVGTRWAR